MAIHLQEFLIHDYKGMHELKLNSLNSINPELFMIIHLTTTKAAQLLCFI